MLNDTNTLIKLAGTLGGIALAQTGRFVGAIPLWAEDAGKWIGVAAMAVGLLTTIGICVGQWLKNIKSSLDLSEQQRRTAKARQHEAEDDVCLRRRATGECPLCNPKTKHDSSGS